jgi:hypothetical protein
MSPGSNFISPEFSLHENSFHKSSWTSTRRTQTRPIRPLRSIRSRSADMRACCQYPRVTLPSTFFFPRISARRDSYDRHDVKGSIVRNVNASMVLAQRLIRTLDLWHNATNKADANVPRILAACTTLRTRVLRSIVARRGSPWIQTSFPSLRNLEFRGYRFADSIELESVVSDASSPIIAEAAYIISKPILSPKQAFSESCTTSIMPCFSDP